MTVAPDALVTLNDAKQAGYCARGMRRWALENGFSDDDFRAFVKDGLPASVILATGDEFGRRVVERKEEREANG